MKKLYLFLAFILLIAIALLLYANNSDLTNPESDNQTADTFENEYMKIDLENGWAASEVSSANIPPHAAVNISKGNYILFINTKASQASGAEGGRFAEIAVGSPSADAVVTVQPSEPCGASETTALNQELNRIDLFVGPSHKTEYCNAPNVNDVWYFSYVNHKDTGGYFNYYGNESGQGYVITMSYNSNDVNNYPIKGSAELNATLAEMNRMIQSLQIK